MTQTNEPNGHKARCILARPCRFADSASCTPLCEHYIAIEGRMKAAGLPADYRLVTLDTSPCREDQVEAYRMIRDYVRTFDRQFQPDAPRIKSLYLYSANPGTGKTTTAAALLNEWLVRHYVGSVVRGRQAEQRPAYFLDVNEWQSLYNGFNRNGVPQAEAERKAAEYYRREALAKNAPFAVLDDIGVRSATEGFRGDLHGVINHRVTNGKPTIYTSNVPMAKLADVFDARLADRVRDMCVEIHFRGGSKRGI